MTSTRLNLIGLSIAAMALLCWQPSALAQATSGGCSLQYVELPPREVIRCENGITIIAERSARFTLLDRNRNGSADAANLVGKALLFDVPSASRSDGFEVITPQAIAAVRGTKWAVDVQANQTSVFVVRGRVAVQRPRAGGAVVLGAGQGVDVTPGSGPLTVKRWPAARVSALLARFGQ